MLQVAKGAPALLVKAPNWIGDCIMATPGLALLRAALPDARIDVLARGGPAGVLMDNPHVTSVIVADDRNLPAPVRTSLRDTRYVAALLLPNSLGSAWLACRLRIPVRVGFTRGGRGLLLTHPIRYHSYDWQTPTPRPLSRKSIPEKTGRTEPPRHMVHYYRLIAEQTLGALRIDPGSIPTPDDLVLPVNVDSQSAVASILEKHGLANAKLAGINPGAAYGGAKRWPAPYISQVADALAAEGYQVVSTASGKEAALTDEVAVHARCTLHRLGEEVDVRGLVALIDRLSLLITNDSGAMHIAAARKIPTVGVFGPTDWNVTRPWSPRAAVVRNSPDCAPCFLRDCPIDHRCMTRLSPEEVLAAARDLSRSSTT